MSIIIDDLYSELISQLELIEQLKFRCTSRFHLNRINSDILKELFDFKTNHSKDKINFINVCRSGYLNLAKFLYTMDTNICAKNESAFRWSCHHGHIEIAKWLYSLGDVNIHVENECSFRLSCLSGHIEVAKWLYELGVDVHAKNECAFRWSCQNGHIEIAKWLYELGDVNIHVENECAFRLSCLSGHIEVRGSTIPEQTLAGSC